MKKEGKIRPEGGERDGSPKEAKPAATLWQIAGVLLKVGATGFGGAMPMLALIHAEYVEKRKWVSQSEFDEAVMVGQIMPGPIAVDAVTHMGYRLRGWSGAVVSVLAFLLPSFVLMLALTLAYLRYGGIPQVKGLFKGLGAGVTAVIAATSWRMVRPHLKDWKATALTGAALAALLVFHLNVILIVVAGGMAGLLLFRQPTNSRGAGDACPGRAAKGGSA